MTDDLDSPGQMKAISGPKKSPQDQGELDGALKQLGYNKDQVYKVRPSPPSFAWIGRELMWPSGSSEEDDECTPGSVSSWSASHNL